MVGSVVGKYRVLAEVGRGAMGIVFRAQDVYLGRVVALKILAEKLAVDPEMLRRFEREGAAAASLCHPNICTVFESGNWKGRPYFAMELLEGDALDQRLKRGPLAAGEVVAVGIGTAAALEAAHALGVVHRDIKPGNLFLTSSGQVKVLDFGLAKQKPQAAPLGDDAPTMVTFVTRKGTILGTLAYMAPEQVRGEALDGRADLYALGVTLYELSTGRLPLGGAEDFAALPGGLGAVVAKLMAREIRQRYGNAREARVALEACSLRAAQGA